MRRFFITIAAVLLLVSPVFSDTSDAKGLFGIYDRGVEFQMVSVSSVEGFTIVNFSPDPIDLRDYYVTDGEGKIVFTESLVLEDLKILTVLKSEPEAWMDIDSYVIVGQNGIKADKKFTLADSGDDLYLMKGDEVVDSIAWGSVYDSGWQGSGFSKVPKKTLMWRDYRSRGLEIYAVWILYVPGMTRLYNPPTYKDAQVLPFSFPESDGSEIVSALQSAQSEVCISIYTITHPTIFSVLAHLCGKGITVKILVEGSPVGGIPHEEIQYLAALQKLGADIHIIKSEDSYKRYQYVHTKYALIDNRTSVITSENWTESSFASNRGWGCVIENEDLARYLAVFFRWDFDGSRQDIKTFREAYPTAIARNIDGFSPVDFEYGWYTASVTPVIAPDSSKDKLYSFLNSAQTRLYSQQLYVEYDWTKGGENPLMIMRDAGMRGVDSRVLVDVTYDDPLDTDYKDGYGLYTFFEDDPYLHVKYENSPKFGMAHNKGIVCDDRVWIG
ncbi:MAG: hypothetical protein J6Y18_00470, partial [Candidatus Methanomethylophilaceae archaeon]|nr:hypothetical protein [Candidatus Methanomethylophilaceae archaeon]